MMILGHKKVQWNPKEEFSYEWIDGIRYKSKDKGRHLVAWGKPIITPNPILKAPVFQGGISISGCRATVYDDEGENLVFEISDATRDKMLDLLQEGTYIIRGGRIYGVWELRKMNKYKWFFLYPFEETERYTAIQPRRESLLYEIERGAGLHPEAQP